MRKQAKLTDDEIKARVEGFENSTQSNLLKIDDWNINSGMDRFLLLDAMSLTISDLNIRANYKSFELIGCRAMHLERYFPIALQENYNIKLGEKFKSKIAIGQYSPLFLRERFNIYHDNEKIELENNFQATIKIPINHSGLQQETFIVNWTNKKAQFCSDTTNFKYYVNP